MKFRTRARERELPQYGNLHLRKTPAQMHVCVFTCTTAWFLCHTCVRLMIFIWHAREMYTHIRYAFHSEKVRARALARRVHDASTITL